MDPTAAFPSSSNEDFFSLHLNAHNLNLLAAANANATKDLLPLGQSESGGLGFAENLYNSQPSYNFTGLFPTVENPTSTATGVNTTPLTDLDAFFTSPHDTLIGSDFGFGTNSSDAKALDINEIIFSSPPASVNGVQQQQQEMNKNVRASSLNISAGSGVLNQGQGQGQGQGLFPSVLPPPPMVSRRTNSTSSTGTPAPAGSAQAAAPVQAQSPEEKIWNGMDWSRVLDEAEQARKETNIPSVAVPIQGSTLSTIAASSPASQTSNLNLNLAANATANANVGTVGTDRIIMTPSGPLLLTPEVIQSILLNQQAQKHVRQQEQARQQAQLRARQQAQAHLQGYERSLALQRYYQAQQVAQAQVQQQQQGSSNVNVNITGDFGFGSESGVAMGMEMFQGMTTAGIVGGNLNANQVAAATASSGAIFESGVGFAFASSSAPSSEYSFPTQSLPSQSQGPTPVSSQRMSFAIPMTNAFGTNSVVGTPGSVFSSIAGMGGAGSPAPGDSVSQVGVQAQAQVENSPLVPLAAIVETDKDGFKIPVTGPIRSVKGIKDNRAKISSGAVSFTEEKGKGKAMAMKGKGKKSGARTLGKGKRPPHDRGQGRKPSTSSSNQDSADSPEEISTRRSHDPNASRLTGTALDMARSSVLAEMDPEDVKKERRREINRRSARTLREKRKAELDEAYEIVRSLRKEVKALREGLKQESEWRRQVEGVFKERGIDLASHGIQTPSTFSTPTPTASTSRQPLDHDMDDDNAGPDSDAQGSDPEDDDDESDFD